MNEMDTNNRDYSNRGYDRDYDNRNYRNYRDDMDYRDYDYRYHDDRNYRDYDYRRDYDRRGGKINNRDYRNYRNYRGGDYYEELEMTMEDMREQYRKLEDISEMVTNPQEKNVIMKVAQAEKQNYEHLKQITK